MKRFLMGVLLLAAAPAYAQTAPDSARRAQRDSTPNAIRLDPVQVSAERVYSTASSRTIRQLDLQLRPRESSQDLLRLAPGLVIAQHAGGGKAEQIFLRGFDADHGTDVAISVDGTPVNLVSHGHGQGYADLHFLLPEVVERVDVRKGPHDARDGDFATAGAVSFHTRDRIPGSVAGIRAGSFGTGRVLAMQPFGGDASSSGGYAAFAAQTGDGPFEMSQEHRRLNGFGKWTMPLRSGMQLSATMSGYDAEWNASGQIPERLVRSGTISRFGAVDPTEGGTTSRYDANLALASVGAESRWEARVYATRYHLDLHSNFTFFLADSIRGDGIRQQDDRWMAGLHTMYVRGQWSAGAGMRADNTLVELGTQQARMPTGIITRTRVMQTSFSAWSMYEQQLGPRARAQFGVRGDAFRFDRRGNAPEWRAIASPKLNIAWDVATGATVFGSLATGFHSNDARDAVQADDQTVLPRALGMEVGARHSWQRATVAAAFWSLDLESELVYVGDEGTTEANGRTRRAGVDVEARAQLLSWLWADADVNLSRARFRDEPAGADHVPLAPTLTSTGGLTARLYGIAAGARYRHVSERAADELNEVRALGHTIAEAFASYETGSVTLSVAVDNIFDSSWNEAQFATTSRLRGEAVPVTELHFTPGSPRTIYVGVQYRW